MTFDDISSTAFVKINKLLFLFYAESKKKALQKYLSFCSACMFWYVLFFKKT